MLSAHRKIDGDRMLMSANQGRQAVPVIHAEKPIISTGYESVLPAIASETFAKKANFDGIVRYIDKNVMIIQSPENRIQTIDLRAQELLSGSGMNSAITHTPIVNVGDQVHKGQILNKNQYIDNSLTQGLNARVAYIPYMGNSFEDGIVISESMAKRMTSLHYDTTEINLDDQDELEIFPMIGQEIKAGQCFVKINKQLVGGSNLGEAYELFAPHDLEIANIEIYPFSMRSARLLDQIEAIYKDSNMALAQFGQKLLFDKKSILKNVGKFTDHGQQLESTKIIIKTILKMSQSLGDKSVNRAAAKGVCTMIYPDSEMPVPPDGKPIDYIINSMAILSRINYLSLHSVMNGSM